MRSSVLLAVTCGGCLAVALPAAAQTPSSPTPSTAYADSPARANPRAGNGKRSLSPDDGKRSPRAPLDWERTEALSPDGRTFETLNLESRMRLAETISGRSEIEMPAGVIDVILSPDSRLSACRFEGPADETGGRTGQVFTVADGKPIGRPLMNPDTDDNGTEMVLVFPRPFRRTARRWRVRKIPIYDTGTRRRGGWIC